MTGDKKIKIHIKNNHWAPGSFPTDAEGEKNFTITEKHLNEALKNYPEIKERLEVFVDWDEENFKKFLGSFYWHGFNHACTWVSKFLAGGKGCS